MFEVWVLRLFHRIPRDKRVTSHLALAARALGAKGMYFSGQFDASLLKTVEKVSYAWGGDFKVKYVKDYLKFIKKWRENGGKIIHLTMYGLPLNDVIEEIKGKKGKKLVVVGGEKVPKIVYKLADWNVSITNQPHSEISALAIFLHELFEGEELNLEFRNAKIKIIPHRTDKKVVKIT